MRRQNDNCGFWDLLLNLSCRLKAVDQRHGDLRTTTSGLTRLTSSIASAPFSASPTTSKCGCCCSAERTMPLTTGWSSATTTRIRTFLAGFVCAFISVPQTAKSVPLDGIRCQYGKDALSSSCSCGFASVSRSLRSYSIRWILSAGRFPKFIDPIYKKSVDIF